MTEQTITGPLGAEFEDTLRRWDAYAEETTVGTVVTIRDAEGEQLFLVTAEISIYDLQRMFFVRDQAFKAGLRAGQDAARLQIRAALGIKEEAR